VNGAGTTRRAYKQNSNPATRSIHVLNLRRTKKRKVAGLGARQLGGQADTYRETVRGITYTAARTDKGNRGRVRHHHARASAALESPPPVEPDPINAGIDANNPYPEHRSTLVNASVLRAEARVTTRRVSRRSIVRH
jgi:hypothetical protein